MLADDLMSCKDMDAINDLANMMFKDMTNVLRQVHFKRLSELIKECKKHNKLFNELDDILECEFLHRDKPTELGSNAWNLYMALTNIIRERVIKFGGYYKVRV